MREPQRFNFVARPAVEVPVAGSPPRRPAPAGEAAQHQGGGAGVCSSPGRGLGPAAGEAAGGAATPLREGGGCDPRDRANFIWAAVGKPVSCCLYCFVSGGGDARCRRQAAQGGISPGLSLCVS